MILPLDCNIVSPPTLLYQFFKPHVGSVHSKSIVHGNLTGVCGPVRMIPFITHVPILQSNVLVHDNGRACLANFSLSTMLLDFFDSSYITSTISENIRWAAAELFKEPEDDEEDEAAVSLSSTECDIYLFGSILLQVSSLYFQAKDHVQFACDLGADL
jgi:hypothetical protein